MLTITLPSPTVTARWLADHLHDVLVVDASADMSQHVPGGYAPLHEQHLARHLPGAVFADVVGALSDPDAALPLTRPSTERLAAALGALGVGEETAVVLYDTGTGSWAARVWWLLRSLGHDRAAVLDGGLRAWAEEGLPLESGEVTPAAATFVPRERPEVWEDRDGVLAIACGERPGTLLNAISAMPAGMPREHATAFTHQIPGSTAVPYPDLIDADGTLLDDDALERALGDLPDPGRTVVYCGSAIGAATTALALVRLGRGDVAVYDGSLAEWLSDHDAPLEER